jgi:membrane-bound lytic murein transglycosylase A
VVRIGFFGSLRLIAIAAYVCVVAAGCGSVQPVRLSSAIAGDVDDLDPASLALAADRDAEALERAHRSEPRRFFQLGARDITAGDLAASARRVAGIAREAKDADALTRELARTCKAWPAGEPAKVTGYYEPLVDARAKPDARFRYPIYSAPARAQVQELHRKLGRTPTRADIDSRGALAGLGLELAWLDDPVARFFLHVQGSGRLRFEDGSERRVGFAASNDLPYVSVGAIMVKEGLLERGGASATAMRRWLAARPDRRDELLERNPRYIFFRDSGAAEAPVGSLGAPLVAGRSIAVDDGRVPPGILAWLRTTKPVVDAEGRIAGRTRMTRFAFAQDTGAAIQGPARVDLYFGSGEDAGLEAGGMNEGGELYLVLCGSSAPKGPIPGDRMAPHGPGVGIRP